MGLGAILESLPMLLKLISLFVDLVSKTPQEKRRDSLADLDNALTLARDKNDLTELSKWFGKRL